ncbi:hypothetical protein [Ruminococcus sp.]
MTTEVTRKQAILLSVLGVVLVIVLFVQLLIRPLMTKASDAKEQLETLNQQYSDLLMQSESYDQNMAALDGWNEKNSEETKKLFPLSDAERIDRFLTFVMHECGVTVNGLSIGQTMQYYIDGEGNLVTASPDDVANTAGTSGTDGSAADGSTADYTATGEYCCDFTYTMEGDYRNMKQMLDFVNRVSFLGITAYSFNSVEKQETAAADGTTTGTEDKFQDLYSFTMTITAYMYKSPLETDRDTQTEESTAAAAETPAA